MIILRIDTAVVLEFTDLIEQEKGKKERRNNRTEVGVEVEVRARIQMSNSST